MTYFPYQSTDNLATHVLPWFADLQTVCAGAVQGVPLSEYTTMGVGGPAQAFVEPQTWDEVAELIRFCAARALPLTWLGKGSNLMVRDGGLVGVVAHLSKGLDAVVVDGDTLYAEAGAASGTVARAAREAGLGGLAFLGGIPGAIGGALRMNAGAYGGETFAELTHVILLTETGEQVEKEASFCQPRYRGTTLPAGWMFKAARWTLTPCSTSAIREQMQAINRSRSTTQPLHMPSSGSWFKNLIVKEKDVAALAKIGIDTPVGKPVNAWRLVDAAGCRGLRVGGAQVSEVHCNFFVNAGLYDMKQGGQGPSATASDFETLSQQVERAVENRLGLTLQREVRWVGALL